MVEINDVVAKLAKLTEQGQVPWKTTVDKATFAATFGRMSVLISTYNTPFGSGNRFDDTPLGRGNRVYQLSVLDEQGDEIDFTTAMEGSPIPMVGEGRPVLVDLYNSAKRSALGVDQKLEELLDAMDRVSGS